MFQQGLIGLPENIYMFIAERVSAIWFWLTEPSPYIEQLDKRRNARLSSGILIVLIGSVALPAFFSVKALLPQSLFVFLFLGLLFSYGLSRTRYYNWGLWISLIFMYSFVLVPILTAQEMNAAFYAQNTMWVIVPLMLASMILPKWQSTVLAAAVIVSLLMSTFVAPPVEMYHVLPVIGLVLTWFATNMAVLHHNSKLELDRQAELKEKANQLSRTNKNLYIEIAERTAAEKKIEASLHEKEVLLKEIHHRVKNNLQIITSMLNLQSVQANNNDVSKALLEGQGRVRSMSLIHESLYRSNDLAHIEFDSYIRELVAQLTQMHQTQAAHVAVDLELEPVFLTMETAVPCGLILNELVSNAIKHAFTDGRSGRVIICLRTESDGRYQLSVSDNGVGLPPDIDYVQSTTLGLQLVNTLIYQIQGELNINNHQGTTISIAFAEKTSKETS